MEALGAVADECEAVRRTIGVFLRWAERSQQTPDRTSGIAWLRAVSERLEPERLASVKACLATWFHLTGGARVGKQSWVGQPAGQSAGGRISGEAASWREAGERLNGYLACKSYSRNTVTCYLGWARRFFRWCRQSGKDLPEVAASDIRGFLEWLASTGVVAKTQNQALNALISFFRHGIGKEPGEFGSYLRARVTRRLPVVLNRKEAAAVINDLEGRSRPMWLLAGVMLGAGLRLREALELRVHDLDLERGTITVRRGKGDKDRVSVLPERIRAGLTAHLADRRAQFERGLGKGKAMGPCRDHRLTGEEVWSGGRLLGCRFREFGGLGGFGFCGRGRGCFLGSLRFGGRCCGWLWFLEEGRGSDGALGVERSRIGGGSGWFSEEGRRRDFAGDSEGWGCGGVRWGVGGSWGGGGSFRDELDEGGGRLADLVIDAVLGFLADGAGGEGGGGEDAVVELLGSLGVTGCPFEVAESEEGEGCVDGGVGSCFGGYFFQLAGGSFLVWGLEEVVADAEFGEAAEGVIGEAGDEILEGIDGFAGAVGAEEAGGEDEGVTACGLGAVGIGGRFEVGYGFCADEAEGGFLLLMIGPETVPPVGEGAEEGEGRDQDDFRFMAEEG
jgi:site-specific recombinase XerD